VAGGLPAVPLFPAPPLPWSKGRNTVASRASRVVIATRCGSTAKCTNVRARKIRSLGLRSVRYCAIACSTFWCVSGFFNSAVATGIPLTTNVRSSESEGLDSE
jgi:hypothetical protein